MLAKFHNDRFRTLKELIGGGIERLTDSMAIS
jgi:hypothetical protein